ncbi:MAG TPA: hypothetical protein DEF27_09470, partial [Oscillatoriales bacterium UBA8482]|nr:hypothetical protein [Oscillatoriales bacterium UBA8482]
QSNGIAIIKILDDTSNTNDTPITSKQASSENQKDPENSNNLEPDNFEQTQGKGVESLQLVFSENFACPEHGAVMEELSPRLFSFNSPFG